jgi:hypothetical protein
MYKDMENLCSVINKDFDREIIELSYFMQEETGDCRINAMVQGIAVSQLTKEKYNEYNLDEVLYMYAKSPVLQPMMIKTPWRNEPWEDHAMVGVRTTGNHINLKIVESITHQVDLGSNKYTWSFYEDKLQDHFPIVILDTYYEIYNGLQAYLPTLYGKKELNSFAVTRKYVLDDKTSMGWINEDAVGENNKDFGTPLTPESFMVQLNYFPDKYLLKKVK